MKYDQEKEFQGEHFDEIRSIAYLGKYDCIIAPY